MRLRDTRPAASTSSAAAAALQPRRLASLAPPTQASASPVQPSTPCPPLPPPLTRRNLTFCSRSMWSTVTRCIRPASSRLQGEGAPSMAAALRLAQGSRPQRRMVRRRCPACAAACPCLAPTPTHPPGGRPLDGQVQVALRRVEPAHKGAWRGRGREGQAAGTGWLQHHGTAGTRHGGAAHRPAPQRTVRLQVQAHAEGDARLGQVLEPCHGLVGEGGQGAAGQAGGWDSSAQAAAGERDHLSRRHPSGPDTYVQPHLQLAVGGRGLRRHGAEHWRWAEGAESVDSKWLQSGAAQ